MDGPGSAARAVQARADQEPEHQEATGRARAEAPGAARQAETAAGNQSFFQLERHWKRQQAAVNMVYGVSLCLAPIANRFVGGFLSSEQLVAKNVLSVHLLPLNLMATSLFF